MKNVLRDISARLQKKEKNHWNLKGGFRSGRNFGLAFYLSSKWNENLFVKKENITITLCLKIN